jgi:nitrous oxidase accessory protein NosD
MLAPLPRSDLSQRPHIFIGSSNEAKDELAAPLADLLAATNDIGVVPWYEAFRAGRTTIEDLAELIEEVDFAAFFLLPEDHLIVRGESVDAARGNILFELGLFMGRNSRDRTFMLVDRDRRPEFPTDIYGTTYVEYRRRSLDELSETLLRLMRKAGPATKVPQGTHVVERGAMGRNVYSTIAEAVDAAEGGDVILIRPGTYREALVINKPIELIGVGIGGNRRPAVRTVKEACITYAAPGMGRVSNLSFESADDGDVASVEAVDGTLVLEGCEVTGRGRACIRVSASGEATIRGNEIINGQGAGVVIVGTGWADVQRNTIARHAFSGLEVSEGAQPRVKNNRIQHGRGGGILIEDRGTGQFERNEIFANREAGIAIMSGADPDITGNRIHDGHSVGIFVGAEGRGAITQNDIYSNSGTGVEVASGGNPQILDNRIYNGIGGGVVLHRDAKAKIELNEIRGNQRAGIALVRGSAPLSFARNRIVDGGAEGVFDEVGLEQGDNVVARNVGGDWVQPETAAAT